MTRKTLVFWEELSEEIEQIADEVDNLCTLGQGTAIDRRHPVAERIRQLGRDMEPPTEPVIHEAKEE